MIYLNLISEEIKQKINLKGVYEIIRSSLFFLLIFVIFISGLFYGAEKFLDNYYKNIFGGNLVKSTQDKTSVYEINFMISSLEEIQSGFIAWSYLLEDISQCLNEGITFSSLKITKGDYMLSLEGEAANRESLADFKNNFSNLKSIITINSFDYDIFQKENIIFKIKANIDYNF